MEMIYAVPGYRAPFVLVNVSRGVQTPVTLEPDHNDVLAARDSGFLQLHCATCQEVLDSTLIAYRLAEDHRVRLPALVNLDGFYLSFTREPVEIPERAAVERFLPPYDPETTRFHAGEPVSQGVVVLGGAYYSYFRYEQHLAAQRALQVYDEVAAEFAQQFGRRYDAVETYRSEDAEIVFFMIGSFSTKAKDAVDRLREAGQAVGLVRPRLLRPYPSEALRRALEGKKGVAVIDQNLSMGMGGVLHGELAGALYGQPGMPPVLASFIGGLGGRDIAAEEFYEMIGVTRKAYGEGITPPPRLLYTADELRQMRKLQAVAHAGRMEGKR
jgi:pyruvate ferredoxin oxidoreductase alpha subunit